MAITGRTVTLEQQLRSQLQRINDQQVRDLVRSWAKAWDEIAVDLEAALADALSAGDGVTTSQLLRSKRLTGSLAAISDKLEELAEDAGVRITGDLRKVIDDAGRAQAQLVASQLPQRSGLVDLDAWSRVDVRQIDAIVKRSTQQITSSTKQLSPSATRAVRRELIRGVASGSNPKVVARRMVERTRGAFNGGLTRALNISRTEMLDAHRAGAAVGQAQHADVLVGWQWIAALGPRTCPACWGQHGTLHKLDEPGPEGHQGCRCARVPVTKSWSDLGIKGIKEPPPVLIDADAAFAKLTAREQASVLGPARFRAWQAGKFPRSKWATKQSNPGWRPSYVPAKPPKVKAPASKPPPKRVASKAKTPATRSTRTDPLAGVPKINPELIANMERRGIDVAEWNRRATNPKFTSDPAHRVNCQRVVQAYELRRRGFDVTAKPNPGDGSGRADVFLRWLDGAEQRGLDSGRYYVTAETRNIVADQMPEVAAQMITNPEQYVRQVVDEWPVGARGWVMFYRDAGAGHIFNIERTATGLRVLEAQVPAGGETVDLAHYMNQVRKTKRRNGVLRLEGPSVFVTRVDDLDFNLGVLEAIAWT